MLEDEFGDIVGKARAGLGFSEQDLARASGLSVSAVRDIECCRLIPDECATRRIAKVLSLGADQLVTIANGAYVPSVPEPVAISGGRIRRLSVGERYRTNCYLLVCSKTRKAAIVDPGAQADLILRAVREEDAEPALILLSHGHGDHTGALEAVKTLTGAPSFIHARDVGLAGTSSSAAFDGYVEEGEHLQCGFLGISVRSLPGHTAGSVAWVTSNAAFVGDALFAGSIGRSSGVDGYCSHLDCLRRLLGSLPDQAFLLPGHGPITTVGDEKSNNPFLAAG